MQMQRQRFEGRVIRKGRAVHLAPASHKDALHQIDGGFIPVHDLADLIHVGQNGGQGFRLPDLGDAVPVIEKAQKKPGARPGPAVQEIRQLPQRTVAEGTGSVIAQIDLQKHQRQRVFPATGRTGRALLVQRVGHNAVEALIWIAQNRRAFRKRLRCKRHRPGAARQQGMPWLHRQTSPFLSGFLPIVANRADKKQDAL